MDTIRQIVKLKQVMQMWRSMTMSTHSRFDDSDESDSSRPRVPPGYFAVYVGAERRRFVIPTRFLNLPLFVSLLERAEEEFGLQMSGGLVLPCEVGFFERLVREIEKDEDVERMKGLDLNEVLRRFSDVGLDSCKEEKSSSCKVFTTPLLHKA
ncbi:auxin-responsive protein SAUR71-like protein [Cinnamomum micranthum f. kanehirae]|uniref:Auxin-responsive protein SAUR71-like protein n=1 Tax=Cinnamomum micranthum f. kanehirae TaxID=337451 RepID=A0A443P6U2_9MAGN|nr:auxin-responsive protein SAUR71-like protein [Cinnamomum micranthum f. kanehirae]